MQDESQSLRLFTPLQYTSEEYWWYSALETEKDSEVVRLVFKFGGFLSKCDDLHFKRN